MEKEIGSQRLADLACQIVRERRWVDEHTGESYVGESYVESDGEVFEVLGYGAARIALLGPDGVVYKVSFDAANQNVVRNEHATVWQMDEEIDVFRRCEMLGIPYTPDFWRWSRFVTAMPRYRTLAEARHPISNSLVNDIMALSCDYSEHNVGVRDDGSVVLIDGGESTSLEETEAWFGVRLD